MWGSWSSDSRARRFAEFSLSAISVGGAHSSPKCETEISDGLVFMCFLCSGGASDSLVSCRLFSDRTSSEK